MFRNKKKKLIREESPESEEKKPDLPGKYLPENDRNVLQKGTLWNKDIFLIPSTTPHEYSKKEILYHQKSIGSCREHLSELKDTVYEKC